MKDLPFTPQGLPDDFLQDDSFWKKFLKAADALLIAQVEIIEGKVISPDEALKYGKRFVQDYPDPNDKELVRIEYFTWKDQPITKAEIYKRKGKISFKLEGAYS